MGRRRSRSNRDSRGLSSRSRLVQRLLDALGEPAGVHERPARHEAVTVAGTEAAGFLIERRQRRTRRRRSARSRTSARTIARRVRAAGDRGVPGDRQAVHPAEQGRRDRGRHAGRRRGAAVLPRHAAAQRGQGRRRPRGHHPLPRPRARPPAADEHAARRRLLRAVHAPPQQRAVADWSPQSHQHVLQLATPSRRPRGSSRRR